MHNEAVASSLFYQEFAMSCKVLFIAGAMLLFFSQPLWADSRYITCSSRDSQYRYCRADTEGQVRLSRQLSSHGCIEGQTWGYDRHGIWVDRGCRAEFTIGRSGYSSSGDYYGQGQGLEQGQGQGQGQVPNLRDLIGVKGRHAEAQMERRGYSWIRTDKSGNSAYSYWRDNRSSQCIVVRTTQGRYASILYTPNFDCNQGGQNNGNWEGGRAPYHPRGDIYWDYSANRPCARGYVNCDASGDCGRRGNEGTCRNTGGGSGGHPPGNIFWDYDRQRPCPNGYVNCDARGACGKRGNASSCR